ncbi:MAG: zinc carboxypeptidase, partial [Comamonadaceae bacterium CG_4_10_14_3_um_filter_60_75]
MLCTHDVQIFNLQAKHLNARKLPELDALERIIELGAAWLDVHVACQVTMPKGGSYPVYVITLGNPSPEVPAVGYFGGVHGLERIGAEVVMAYLHSLVMRLQWDSTLHKQLESLRLVFMPIVNPGGLALG